MLRALHDNIIVEQVYENLKRKSGIIIPETAREKQTEGKVVAVGPEYKGDAKIGDVLAYHEFMGIAFEWEEKEYVLLKQDQAVAAIENYEF